VTTPCSQNEHTCDVAVIGGALSGAATALLLKQQDPSLRVVLIEKSTHFKRRVGEATVEVSAYFLCRVLGLTRFLTQTQLCKNGLRFWFSNPHCSTFGDCSEIGGKHLSTVPSFLVDRAVLDEEVLRRAAAAGVVVRRPASVTEVQLQPGGMQRLSLHEEGESGLLLARWVVDASGVRCLLARANGWWQPTSEHPTLAAWSRWRGVRDWDQELGGAAPGDGFAGIRSTATNHLVGEGWWAWWINLKGEETSIGVVLDPRRASWPQEGTVAEKIRALLSQHAAGRHMLDHASCVDGDVHFRRNLAYSSSVQAGDGFVLVGDASAFLDPLYSPGMDWISFTSCAAVHLIQQWRAGVPLEPCIAEHNRDFTLSYRRMFEALYEHKYDYLGEFDLMQAAFRLDIAFYYLFVARFIFRGGIPALRQPPYSHPNAWPIFRLMRFYNHRFATIASRRAAAGEAGARSHHRRDLFRGFNFRTDHLLRTVLGALLRWGIAELGEAWRLLLRPRNRKAPQQDTPPNVLEGSAH